MRGELAQGVVGVRDNLVEQAMQVGAAQPVQPGAAFGALIDQATDPQFG
jgi:hypothetical protein